MPMLTIFPQSFSTPARPPHALLPLRPTAAPPSRRRRRNRDKKRYGPTSLPLVSLPIQARDTYLPAVPRATALGLDATARADCLATPPSLAPRRLRRGRRLRRQVPRRRQVVVTVPRAVPPFVCSALKPLSRFTSSAAAGGCDGAPSCATLRGACGCVKKGKRKWCRSEGMESGRGEAKERSVSERPKYGGWEMRRNRRASGRPGVGRNLKAKDLFSSFYWGVGGGRGGVPRAHCVYVRGEGIH